MLSLTALFLASPLLMLHLDAVGSFPKPLTAKQERELLERYFNGDLQARGKLIEHNLRLVSHIIKKYYTKSADQDDLISIGTIGLIKGVSTYRPDKGVRLATYASRCIENEILMYFRGARKSASDVSLSDSIDTDKDGNSISLLDVLSTDEDMFEDLSARETRTRLATYVTECLDEREGKIIALRYGLCGGDKPLTQREVAAKLDISRSYVSRIEKRALQKLRQRFEEDDMF
ncbi:MAG: RNA polymerase sporulation sigma factor SigK [Oscillospiraceae bacterium]|nr:RNA polymerase sporulation sigma factor SigK [Oscillospiraceae bacterium]